MNLRKAGVKSSLLHLEIGQCSHTKPKLSLRVGGAPTSNWKRYSPLMASSAPACFLTDPGSVFSFLLYRNVNTFMCCNA